MICALKVVSHMHEMVHAVPVKGPSFKKQPLLEETMCDSCLTVIASWHVAGVDAGPFVLVNTRSSLCIQQANSTSDESTPADPTQLVLLPAGCKDAAPHVQFMFTADGQLKHISSGQCIAPASPVDDDNDNPAAVLKPCKGSEGNTSMQWNLTAMGSLQHRQSSKCLHPEGGQPKAGIRIHLYKGCDQDRLEFMPIPPDQVASSLQLPSDKHLEVDIGRCVQHTARLLVVTQSCQQWEGYGCKR